jgi:hypothetical protein
MTFRITRSELWHRWQSIKHGIAIPAILVALLFLSIAAGSIWFHLAAWRNIMHNEGVFDGVLFCIGLLIIALANAGRRAVLWFTPYPQEAKQLKLQERLQFENELRANQIQVVTTLVVCWACSAVWR